MTNEPNPYQQPYDPTTAPPVMGEHYQQQQPGHSPQLGYHAQQPSYSDPYAQPGYAQQPGYADPYAQHGYSQPGYAQPGYSSPYAQPGYAGYSQYGYPTGPPPQNGFGIAGMVLGIVAVPGLCCYIAPIVAIVGGILSAVGLSKANKGEATNKGMAIAGLVLSIITLAVCGLFGALGFTSFFLENGFDSG